MEPRGSENTMGPKIEPCGTPNSTGAELELRATKANTKSPACQLDKTKTTVEDSRFFWCPNLSSGRHAWSLYIPFLLAAFLEVLSKA